MAISDKAAQLKINKQVKDEMARITKKANAYASTNAKARGVIKEVMDKNKQAAHDEVVALSKAAHADFKKDLTHSTEKLYEKMAKDETAQNLAINTMHKNLDTAKAAAAESLDQAKKIFGSKTTTLANAITANMESYKKRITKLTGVTRDWEKASAKDREQIH